MYKPNPISKLSSWLASQFDRWTAVHMLAGGSIANLLKNFTDTPKIGVFVWVFIIAVIWEIAETKDYSTPGEMYKDYGGQKEYHKNTIIDILVALVIASFVIWS